MLSQVKNKKTGNFLSTISLIRNRRGISVIVGYVLLVSITIIMATIVFAWLKTYVPTESTKCPDGVSVLIKDYVYDCKNSLNLTIKNNGRFSIAGYFIHAINSSEQELATIDLSPYLDESFGGFKLNSWVKFHQTRENTLEPEHQKNQTFNLPDGATEFGAIKKVEIIAAMYQTENGKQRFLTCTSSRVRQEFAC